MNQKNTKNSVECMFIYTTDNAQAALDEIKLQIKNAGLEVEDIGIHEEERIFRNAYGKEVSKRKFRLKNWMKKKLQNYWKKKCPTLSARKMSTIWITDTA